MDLNFREMIAVGLLGCSFAAVAGSISGSLSSAQDPYGSYTCVTPEEYALLSSDGVVPDGAKICTEEEQNISTPPSPTTYGD